MLFCGPLDGAISKPLLRSCVFCDEGGRKGIVTFIRKAIRH